LEGGTTRKAAEGRKKKRITLLGKGASCSPARRKKRLLTRKGAKKGRAYVIYSQGKKKGAKAYYRREKKKELATRSSEEGGDYLVRKPTRRTETAEFRARQKKRPTEKRSAPTEDRH